MKKHMRSKMSVVALGVVMLGSGTSYADGTYDGVTYATFNSVDDAGYSHQVTGSHLANGNAIVFSFDFNIGYGPQGYNDAYMRYVGYTEESINWVWVPDNVNPSAAPWVQPQYLYPFVATLSTETTDPGPGYNSGATAELNWGNDRYEYINSRVQSGGNDSDAAQPAGTITHTDGPYRTDSFSTYAKHDVSYRGPQLYGYVSIAGATAKGHIDYNGYATVRLENASADCPPGAVCY